MYLLAISAKEQERFRGNGKALFHKLETSSLEVSATSTKFRPEPFLSINQTMNN